MGLGYVLPGAGAVKVAGKLGLAAKVGENTSKLGKIGQYAKEELQQVPLLQAQKHQQKHM